MKIKKEAMDNNFFEYFKSILKYNILNINLIYDESKNIEKKYYEALYNQCFDIFMYLSTKTLVLDIILFSQKYEHKEKAYVEYIKLLRTKKGLEKFFEKYNVLYLQV